VSVCITDDKCPAQTFVPGLSTLRINQPCRNLLRPVKTSVLEAATTSVQRPCKSNRHLQFTHCAGIFTVNKLKMRRTHANKSIITEQTTATRRHKTSCKIGQRKVGAVIRRKSRTAQFLKSPIAM